MDREEILKKIKEIRKEVEKDQLNHLRAKIMERKFHFHTSHRRAILRIIPEKIRKRLILEVSMILQPILDNQKEINLRFLKEIELLREALSAEQRGPADEDHKTHGPAV
jgi:hypothetical protein